MIRKGKIILQGSFVRVGWKLGWTLFPEASNLNSWRTNAWR
jgi:hypothetical protein